MPGERVVFVGKRRNGLTLGREYKLKGVDYAIILHYQFLIINDLGDFLWVPSVEFNYSE